MHASRPAVQYLKLAAAIAGICAGLFCVAGSLIEAARHGSPVGALLTATAFLAPSLWWLFCQKRDQYLANNFSLADALGIDGDTHACHQVGFLDSPSPPAPVRHWFAISVVCIGLFLVGTYLIAASTPLAA